MELFRTWNTDAALAHLVALAVAYVLALPIGWNREREERSAGLRTFPLVAMAACGFVMIATEVLGAGPPTPTSAGRSGRRSATGNWTLR